MYSRAGNDTAFGTSGVPALETPLSSPPFPGSPVSFDGAYPTSTEWATQYTAELGNGTVDAGNPAVSRAGLTGPQFVVYDPTTERLYVSGGTDRILVIDPSRFALVSTLDLGRYAGALAYDSADGTLLVESNSSVLAVDPRTGSVEYSIGDPIASAGQDGTLVLDPATDQVWVTSELAGNVSIVDLRSRSLIGMRPVAAEFVDVVGGVYEPLNGRIYLVNWDRDEVEMFDGSTLASLGSIDLSDYCCFAGGITLDSVNNNLEVTEVGVGGTILEISPVTGHVIDTASVGGFPSGTAFDPYTGDLYVPEPARGFLTVLNASSNLSFVEKVRMAQDNPLIVFQVQAVDVPQIDRVYVATYTGGTVDEFSATEPSSNGTVNFGVRPTGSVADAACGCVVVYDDAQSALDFVDDRTLAVDRIVPIPIFPSGLLYDPADASLWVTYDGLFSASIVRIYNGSTGAVETTLADRYSPAALAYSPGADRVFVGNLASDNVSVFNASSLARVGSVALPDYPSGLLSISALDELDVAYSDSQNLTVISAGNDTVTGTISLPLLPTVGAYDGSSDSILVASYATPDVYRVNASNGAVIATADVPFVSGIAVDPDSGDAFLMLYSDEIVVWNFTDGDLTSIPAGVETASGVWVEGVGVFANDPGGGTVLEIAASPGRLLTDPRLLIAPEESMNGTEVSADVEFNGGTAPFTYTFSGLPPACDAAGGPSWNCTPSAPGEFPISVTVDDSVGNSLVVTATFWVTGVEPVTFLESGLPEGSTWTLQIAPRPPVTLTGTTYSIEEPDGLYGYAANTSVPNYLAQPPAGAFSVDLRPRTVLIHFLPTYPVQLTESGLWVPFSWTVYVNGGFLTSTTSTITTALPNGTYSLIPAAEARYHLGYVPFLVVQGGPAHARLHFYRISFRVSFVASGLPLGAPWRLEFSGSTASVGNSTEVFDELNGSYPYLISGPAGYRLLGMVPEGAVEVLGANTTVDASFGAGTTYSIDFESIGLAAGTSWCVDLAGTICSSTADLQILNATPATYRYELIAPTGYWVGTSGHHHDKNGTVTLHQAEATVRTHYRQILAYLWFDGGPNYYSGVRWSITLTSVATGHSITKTRTAFWIGFHVPWGAYRYSVAAIPGFYPTPPGTVNVTVGGGFVIVDLRPYYYDLTFTESGLPAGSTWGVRIDGENFTTNASTLVLEAVNGTYHYTLLGPVGYRHAGVPAVIHVRARPVEIQVSFWLPTPRSATSSGFLASTFLTGPGPRLL